LVCDADDCRGPQGPAGPTLFKRMAFSQTVQPASQPAVVLATMTFTPPGDGFARLAGRGFCSMAPIVGSNNQISIAGGTSAASALATPNSEKGFVIVPMNSTNGAYQNGWTSDSIISVTGGMQHTAVLVGRHEAGNTSNDCTGTFTVEFFTGMLLP